MVEQVRHRIQARLAAGGWEPGELTALRRLSLVALVVGLVGAYSSYTLTFAASEVGADVRAQGTVQAVIRIGALITLGAVAVADRIGRQRALWWLLVLAAVASAATAVLPGLGAYAATQTVVRGVSAAAGLVVMMVVAEVVAPARRALAAGLLTTGGAVGIAVMLLLLPVADLGPRAWRWTFVLILPATWLSLRQLHQLPETHRYVAAREAAREAGREAAREAGREAGRASAGGLRASRLAALVLMMALSNLLSAPAFQLMPTFLREARGFSGAGVSAFVLLTSVWALVGMLGGGWLADRWSRRGVLSVSTLLLAGSSGWLYSSSGPPMWAWSVVMATAQACVLAVLGALIPEVFGTLRRGVGSGVANLAYMAGGALGLFLVGALAQRYGYATATWAVALPSVIAILPLWLLPDGAGRSLEEINPEDERVGADIGATGPLDLATTTGGRFDRV
jgi:MFS family permease